MPAKKRRSAMPTSCASSTTDPLAASGDLFSHPAEHIRPGHDLAAHQLSADVLENRPQDFPLLAADPRLAAQARYIAICFPARQLPGIDDITPT
jgi:hypothetical protein